MSGSPKIRAVVFDLDGLMLNTEDVFELAGVELLARRGLQMTDDIRRGMMGRRAHEAFEVLKRKTGLQEDLMSLMLETKELFAELSENRLGVMPGLINLLDLIEERQLPKAVATSSPRAYMEYHLEKFHLRHRFPVTFTAEDVTHGKPHPEIYLTVAASLSVEPSEMLVLEDSETGSQAAASAGAFVVSVPTRHTTYGDFSRSHLVISSLEDAGLIELFQPK
ncbi:MAG: HAD family hydrolase [Planctomycetota bacterium]